VFRLKKKGRALIANKGFYYVRNSVELEAETWSVDKTSRKTQRLKLGANPKEENNTLFSDTSILEAFSQPLAYELEC